MSLPDSLLESPMHGDSLVPAARDAVDRIAYSPAEAARVLGCTRQTVHALINRGELHRYKVGRLTKLNAAEVLAMVGEGGPDAPAA